MLLVFLTLLLLFLQSKKHRAGVSLFFLLFFLFCFFFFVFSKEKTLKTIKTLKTVKANKIEKFIMLAFDPNRVSREKQYMRRLTVSLVEFGMGSGGSSQPIRIKISALFLWFDGALCRCFSSYFLVLLQFLVFFHSIFVFFLCFITFLFIKM